LVLLPELLLADEPLSLPEAPLLPLEDEADGLEPLELEGWSLLELPELLEGELGVLEDDDDALPLLSFFARLPVEPDGDEDAMPDEPEDPDEPDWESRESLPRSQADRPNVAAIAAATAVRKNFLCSMSTVS
jgi:hypothetical protein